MTKRLLCMIAVALVVVLFPFVGVAEVYAYSVENNVGTVPQEVRITVETSSDVLGVNLVDGTSTFIPSSVSQTKTDSQKVWVLSTFVANPCNDEWRIYLKDNNESWADSGISFFVSINSNTPPAQTAAPVRWSTGPFDYAYADTKDYSDNRINSHSGPDNSYMDSGSYKTRKITGLSALYREKNGGVVWIYAEMYYQNGYKRRLYFKNNQIYYGDVPFVTFTQTPARLTEKIVPTYGPAPDYDDFEDERYQKVTLDAGHSVSILHEDNGYFFIEFVYGGKDCRAWVPTYTVEVR